MNQHSKSEIKGEHDHAALREKRACSGIMMFQNQTLSAHVTSTALGNQLW